MSGLKLSNGMSSSEFHQAILEELESFVEEMPSNYARALLTGFKERTIVGENVLLAAFRCDSLTEFSAKLRNESLVMQIINHDFVQEK